MSSATSKIRFWRHAFLVLIFIQNFVGAFFMPASFALMDSKMLLLWCVLCILLSPLMMVGVIGIQIKNPFSDSYWELPRDDSNPVHLGNPLVLAHFVCQMAVVASGGNLLASIWCGWKVFLLGVTGLLVGAGWFLGLRMSIHLASEKIQPPSVEHSE